MVKNQCPACEAYQVYELYDDSGRLCRACRNCSWAEQVPEDRGTAGSPLQVVLKSVGLLLVLLLTVKVFVLIARAVASP